MKNKIGIMALLLWTSFSMAQGGSMFTEQADQFFKKYVKEGRVDYASLKANPEMLEKLLQMTKEVSVSKENAAQYQSFWINGYNVLVIKGIVDNYPLKSPLDVAGFFDKKKHDIGGISITLNDIENKLLRANFPSEARFHFVLVCAGLGCPPIINSSYKASTLSAQLEEQAKIALNNSDFIRVNKNKVKISQIFEWYKGDFTQGGKSLVDYINQYRVEKLPGKAKISYYTYDWTLNEMK
ncbi:MAG: DUF547 domain-containing protein [Flavobacteriaceae bacterium]